MPHHPDTGDFCTDIEYVCAVEAIIAVRQFELEEEQRYSTEQAHANLLRAIEKTPVDYGEPSTPTTAALAALITLCMLTAMVYIVSFLPLGPAALKTLGG